MRSVILLATAAALLAPGVSQAQQVSVGGWVDHVDTRHSTIRIRTFGNPRTIEVAPDAVVRVNGKAVRLDQLPLDSRIDVTAQAGPNGVLRATAISARTAAGQPASAAPPGAVINGRLVRVDVPSDRITVRTQSGDFTVPLGSAPIRQNGRLLNLSDLRPGQQVRVQRSLPTAASTEYVTQSVTVSSPLPPASIRPTLRAPGRHSRLAGRIGGRRGAWPLVTVSVDGNELAARGVLMNGRTLLPLRALAERLGGTLVWDVGGRSAWAAFPQQGKTIHLRVGSRRAEVYAYAPGRPRMAARLERSFRLDQPPVLLGGRVLAPLAAAAQVTGARLQFEPERWLVIVQTLPTGRTASR